MWPRSSRAPSVRSSSWAANSQRRPASPSIILNILAGVTVAGGILLVFGPSAIIPALVAGTATALLTDIQFRPMNQDEINLAFRVFKDTLPIERIVLTNLYNPTNTANGFLAREFTIPGIADGKILVNMGKNFEHTLEPDVQQNVRGTSYQSAGQVLIHELTHAWQIHHSSFLPGLLCKALTSANYKLDEAKVREHASWSGVPSISKDRRRSSTNGSAHIVAA